MCAQAIARLEGLFKEYLYEGQNLQVLRGVDFTVHLGEFIAIMGASGSGKSTLLHILGCLDRPSGGKYLLDGKEVSNLTENQLAALRSHYIGFVFQDFNLLPHATVYENVALPFLYSKFDPKLCRQQILQAVTDVGLSHRLGHLPSVLSGGEKQRVAIARALVTKPELILADEPTGNLDSAISHEILELFCRLHDNGATILMVTHDPQVAATADRIVKMYDGRLNETV